MKGLTKLMVAAVATLPFLLGQGCPMPQPPTFDRLAPNSTLRAACSGYGMQDSDITAFLQAVEGDRLNGFSRSDEQQLMIGLCSSDVRPYDCQKCLLAVIEQIYAGNP